MSSGKMCGEMSDWLHELPVVWMTVVVFATIYAMTAAIYGIVVALAVGERGRAFKAISPGMLSPLGIIFGLFVAFVAASASVLTPAPVIPPPAKTVGSITFRGIWQCEVVDAMELLRAVVEGEVNISVILPNQAVLNELVRKQGVRDIPGCRIWEKEIDQTRT